MAVYGWGTDSSVADWLFTEGHRFDFYQAVTLLERLAPDGISVGEGSEPDKETVRFLSKMELAFPPSDVAKIHHTGREVTPAHVTVNFLGLAGWLGPMPAPYTELLLERSWQKDTALRDFIDIFNHRLVSLMYRVRKLHRVGLDFRSPDQTPVARYLFALMGLGTPGLQGRMQVKDRALLFYAGLMAQRPRSMGGLESILTDYFNVTVQGRQFCGQWYHLEADQVTTIGVTGQNQRLGCGAVLGTRVWEQQGKFELHLGPLTLTQFMDFLPIGRGFRSLCEITQFYVEHELDFSFRLALQAGEVPELRLRNASMLAELEHASLQGAEVPAAILDSVSGSSLGWTSWLKTREWTADDSQVRLSHRRL